MWLVWKAKTTKEERDVAFKTGLVHLPEGPALEVDDVGEGHWMWCWLLWKATKAGGIPVDSGRII